MSFSECIVLVNANTVNVVGAPVMLCRVIANHILMVLSSIISISANWCLFCKKWGNYFHRFATSSSSVQQNIFRKLIFSFPEIFLMLFSFSEIFLMLCAKLKVYKKRFFKVDGAPWEQFGNFKTKSNQTRNINELCNQSQRWVFGENKKRWFISPFIALLSSAGENSFQ